MSTLPHASGLAVHRYFEVSLFLLVTVGFLALASTGRLDIVSTLLVAAALVTKALRYRRHREPELSPQVVTGLTWFYFIFYAVDFVLLSGGWPEGFIPSTTRLVLFIAVVKIFSARTNRDYLWLTLVAFMEILAAATLTVDTTFLVLFFLFLVVGISTFISFEIKRGTETARTTPLAAGSTLGRRLERSLLVTSLSVALSTLLLATVFFFLLPRVTAGYLSAYGYQPEQISGFSNEVTLGDIGTILRNPAVVMRIRAEGEPRQLEGLRWRGIALARFDGHHWSVLSSHPAVFTSPDGRFLLPTEPLRLSSLRGVPRYRMQYRVLLEPVSRGTLFAAAVPLEVRGRFRVLGQDDAGSLFSFRAHYAQVGYDVASDISQPPPELLRSLPADYPEEVLHHYLQLPRLDPRVEELARQVTAGFDNPYDKAAVLENYLRTQFGYTLELPATPEDDPVAQFLFERRQGHCEYFAAAMAVMLRSLGIPARLVNGFQTGEYNEVGENYIVRASDAHTWVEVFFPGVGWAVFDPTPPDPAPPAATWWTTLLHYADAVDLWWDEWVINYDDAHQWQLARNARDVLAGSLRARYWFRQKRREATTWMHDRWQRLLASPYTLPVGGVLALAVLLLLRGRALRAWLHGLWLLRGGGGRARALSAAEATLVYQRLLAVLRRRGLRKSPAQTPLEFSAGVSPPQLAANVAEFTRLYNQARFGQAGADVSRLVELLQQVRSWKPAK